MIPILKYNIEGDLKQVDEIAKGDLYNAVHNRMAENDEETLDGTCIDDYGDILDTELTYLLVPYNNSWREFIIMHTEQYDGQIDFNANASYFEFLKKSKPREPQKLEKITLQEAMEFCLTGTRFEPGTIEYAGTATVKWVDYNSPYDILKIICTAFDVQFEARIEVDYNSVVRRYIDVRQKGALFNGKEIVRGKDLINLKRTVDKSEVVTALLCVGPEQEEQEGQEAKPPITTVVTNEEAQARWGEPDGKYIWDVYSPETENQNMTLKRLRTLGHMALNKRINSVVEYDIEQVDLSHQYPHEFVNFGDLVRIKDTEFKPPLYAESEVIEIKRDLLNPGNTQYKVGNIKEFKESDLLQKWGSLWVHIRKKLNDSVTNVNTIVNDVVAGQLEHVEKKVYKSPTPPENPVNDMYWFDTSNPEVGVLKRYFNGEWIVVSNEEKEDMQGLTREIAMYRSLLTTFENLAIQHQKYYSEVTNLIDNEFLVDEAVKDELNAKLSGLVSVYGAIKNRLDKIDENTATIGYLIDTQALFQRYLREMQELYNVVEQAKIAIDKRIKLLQSQYTDEKYNKAMESIASSLGFELSEDGLLVGESSVISGAVEALRLDTEEKFETVVKTADYEKDKDNIVTRLDNTETSIEQLPDEINQTVSKNLYEHITEYYPNMLENTDYKVMPDSWNANIEIVDDYASVDVNRAGRAFGILFPKTTSITQGVEYSIVFDYKTNDVTEFDYMYFMTPSGQSNVFLSTIPHEERIAIPDGEWHKAKMTLTALEDRDNLGLLVGTKTGSHFDIRNLRMFEGTDEGPEKAEDGYEKLHNLSTQVNQQAEQIKLKASSKDFNKTQKTLNKTLSEVVIDALDGVNLSFDDNGNVSDINIDNQGIQFNSDKININKGDVVIQNGVTSIKDLVANKIHGGSLSSMNEEIVFNLDKSVLNVYRSGAVNFFSNGRISFNNGPSRVDIFQGVTPDGRNVLHMGGDLFAYGTGPMDPNRESFVGLTIRPGDAVTQYSSSSHFFTAGGGSNGNKGFMIDLTSRNHESNPSITLKPYFTPESGGSNFYLGYHNAPFNRGYIDNLNGLRTINDTMKLGSITHDGRTGFTITNGEGWGLAFTDAVYVFNASTQKIYRKI